MTTMQEAFEKEWADKGEWIDGEWITPLPRDSFYAGYAAAIAVVKENYADSIFGRSVYYLPEDTP